jgi:hypothetical protein
MYICRTSFPEDNLSTSFCTACTFSSIAAGRNSACGRGRSDGGGLTSEALLGGLDFSGDGRSAGDHAAGGDALDEPFLPDGLADEVGAVGRARASAPAQGLLDAESRKRHGVTNQKRKCGRVWPALPSPLAPHVRARYPPRLQGRPRVPPRLLQRRRSIRHKGCDRPRQRRGRALALPMEESRDRPSRRGAVVDRVVAIDGADFFSRT